MVNKFIFHMLQVVENGNPTERKNWFPDIEPFFKLLGYENIPPYLKVSGVLEILPLTLWTRKCYVESIWYRYLYNLCSL